MARPILSTKLNPPRQPDNLVSRARLVNRLREGLNRQLTLVSAPAGFGKTTLAAEWLAALSDDNDHTDHNGDAGAMPAVAWFGLDESDSDPALFFAGLVAALQKTDATLGESAEALLQSPQSLAPQYILGDLINELANLSHKLIVVLDDYHLIDSQEVHEAVSYLLNHQPPQLHLMLVTRSDPPLPLARLRVRQQMLEIRAQDLRFTHDEAAEFLQTLWGIAILPEHVQALAARTEGWIAGLQLAALSMERLQTDAEIADFIAAFTGSHRYVLDYLADEVLQQQPPDIQDFLLRTSILSHLCADLCQTVLEIPEAQSVLERLEAANLFLVPLDNERKWYRYHHLFGDLLRHRLRRQQPDLAPQLHRRASLWYEGQGLFDEAIVHAVSADETTRAAGLIEAARWQMHGRGELATLKRWLDLLPAEQVDSTGALAMIRGWLLVNNSQMVEAEAYLSRVAPRLEAQASADGDEAPAWRGEMAVLRAEITLKRGNCQQAIANCREAQQLIPADRLAVRSMLEGVLGKAYQICGDLEAAQRAYAAAAEIGAQTSDHMAVLNGLCNQATLYRLRGKLHRAATLQQEALTLTQDRRGRSLPLAGVPLVGLAKIYREWNRLDDAIAHLEEAVRLGREAGLDGLIVDATITLALVHMAQGADAHATLAQAKAITQHWQRPLTDMRMDAFAARLWLAQGQLGPAIAWADAFAAQHRAAPASETGDLSDIEHAILVRVRLAQGKLDEIEAVLTRMLAAAEAAGRANRVIELLALQALYQQALGNVDDAVHTLTRALALGQPEGYVRTFADEGRAMGELLARAAMGESTAASYAAQVLAALPTPIAAASAPHRPQADTSPSGAPQPEAPSLADAAPPDASDLAQWLAEPLSERELEVLQLVAQGCSNREIGEKLYISLGTVKKHMENIHGKLYVNNRTQAVARAREFGLL